MPLTYEYRGLTLIDPTYVPTDVEAESWGLIEDTRIGNIVDWIGGDCLSVDFDATGQKHGKVYNGYGLKSFDSNNTNDTVTIGMCDDATGEAQKIDIVIGNILSRFKVLTNQDVVLLDIVPDDSEISIGGNSNYDINIGGSGGGDVAIGTGSNKVTMTELGDFYTRRNIDITALCTFDGWSAYEAYNKVTILLQIGSLVVVHFNVFGTSDQQYARITLPFVPVVSAAMDSVLGPINAMDGSAWLTDTISAVASNGAPGFVEFGPPGAASAYWTASGMKGIAGTITMVATDPDFAVT